MLRLFPGQRTKTLKGWNNFTAIGVVVPDSAVYY